MFSKRRKQTGGEFKIKPKCDNNYDRPWKYSILLASIKHYRKSRVPVQTVDHLIFQCKRLKNEREILKNSVLKVGKCELTNRITKNSCVLHVQSITNIFHPVVQ